MRKVTTASRLSGTFFPRPWPMLFPLFPVARALFPSAGKCLVPFFFYFFFAENQASPSPKFIPFFFPFAPLPGNLEAFSITTLNFLKVLSFPLSADVGTCRNAFRSQDLDYAPTFPFVFLFPFLIHSWNFLTFFSSAFLASPYPNFQWDGSSPLWSRVLFRFLPPRLVCSGEPFL